jgi:RNA polymerase sigma-70 factor (ECF subfamily)
MVGKLRQYTDSELVVAIKQGSEPAFEELFNRYQSRVLSFALRLRLDRDSAEEVVQEIFIKLWSYRQSLNQEIPIGALLFKISRNQIINYFRSISRESLSRKQYLNSISTIQHGYDNSGDHDYLDLMDKAIDKLPSKRKAIFFMCKKKGMSYDEISKELGISKDTVRLQMIKSLKALRKSLHLKPSVR